MKIKFTFSLLLIFVLECFGTSWKAALPYRQTMKGQTIVIKATPYSPFSPSPIIGETNVYAGKKFLYKIDKYYREIVLASNDGQFLFVLKSPLLQPIFHETGALEIYKNGISIKEYSIGELVDLCNLKNDGPLLNWVYSYAVNNDNIMIQTVYNKTLKISFENLQLESVIADNKLKSNSVRRKYKSVKLPERTYFPTAKLNDNLEQFVVNEFGLAISNTLDRSYSIYLELLVDQAGNPEIYSLVVRRHKNTKDWLDYGTDDEEMAETLKNWILKQTFESSEIPKEFKKYMFKTTVLLN